MTDWAFFPPTDELEYPMTSGKLRVRKQIPKKVIEGWVETALIMDDELAEAKPGDRVVCDGRLGSLDVFLQAAGDELAKYVEGTVFVINPVNEEPCDAHLFKNGHYKYVKGEVSIPLEKWEKCMGRKDCQTCVNELACLGGAKPVGYTRKGTWRENRAKKSKRKRKPNGASRKR